MLIALSNLIIKSEFILIQLNNLHHLQNNLHNLQVTVTTHAIPSKKAAKR